MLTETFGIFTSGAMTSEHSGFLDLIHQTDESDNPQDTIVYFGSLGSGGLDTADRQCQADSDPGVDNIVIDIVDILPEWDNATAYVVGDCVQPTTPDGYRYRCTTAGTSGGSEPGTWNNGAIGATTTDNTVVWTMVSAKHEVTEVVLALSSPDLATNTPGASLSLGNTVTSGTSGDIPIYIRVINNVNTVSNNTATPEIALQWNALIETEV